MVFLQNYMEFWNFPSKFSVCTFGTCCTYAVSSQKGAADKCWICTNVSKSKQSKCYSISLVLWCLEINIGSAYLGSFGAFLSMSAAYSLPNWWRLQFCLVTEKCRLGNTSLKKGKRGNWSPTWNTCSSHIFIHGTPMVPGDSWEQSCPVAWCQPVPVLDVVQPLPHTSYCLLLPSLEDFFSIPCPILCVKLLNLLALWWHVLFSSREQILISKYTKLFCLIILYFLSSCLSWLPSSKPWFSTFKIYCNIQIVSIYICMWDVLGKFALKTQYENKQHQGKLSWLIVNTFSTLGGFLFFVSNLCIIYIIAFSGNHSNGRTKGS